MPRAFPRLPPDAIAEASSVASSTPGTPATIKATSFGSIQPKRLVWCHDATGRDGELIQRIINKGRAPKSEDERQLRLALPHAQTSVWRLFRAAERSEQGDGQRQVCRYYAGVACGPRQFDELLPATTGSDFARRLKTAYLDMAREYAFGDEIVMIGFSRGAYLCRAFALILDRIGMIPADLVVDASGTRGYDLLSIALDAYIDLFRGRRLVKARDDIETITRMLRAARTGQDGTSSAGGTIVHALGLFDSVCAFSWPRSLYGKGGDYIWRRMFGDDASDELCPPNVEHAFHAVALTEDRIDYPLTHLRKNDCIGSHNVGVAEVAFRGSHSDVGGGHIQHDIADLSLCHIASLLQDCCPDLLCPQLFNDLASDHTSSWGELAPRLYTFSLSYGAEAVCLLRRGPRAFISLFKPLPNHQLVIHASVPNSVRSTLPTSATVAPLWPREMALRDAWATRDPAVKRKELESREVLAWAMKETRQR